MIDSTPQFRRGIFSFTGAGYTKPTPLPELTYSVPSDKRGQTIFFRAGNSSAELITLVLLRDGQLMRLFPIGAKASLHVPLVVVEDLHPDQKLEVLIAAPEGISGTVVVDFGLLEI
jgi:hypothetical protein